jgi:hypothetical protein
MRPRPARGKLLRLSRPTSPTFRTIPSRKSAWSACALSAELSTGATGDKHHQHSARSYDRLRPMPMPRAHQALSLDLVSASQRPQPPSLTASGRLRLSVLSPTPGYPCSNPELSLCMGANTGSIDTRTAGSCRSSCNGVLSEENSSSEQESVHAAAGQCSSARAACIGEWALSSTQMYRLLQQPGRMPKQRA